MKVLIACEYSGVVRDAFIAKGHDVISCDLFLTEKPGPHFQGDVLDIINDGFDLMIAHPECTYLTCTANRSFVNNPERWKKRLEAMLFVHELMNVDIPQICIENPVGVISTHIRKPDQYIEPFEFGHKDSKKTGLWLKGLSLLKATDVVTPEYIICKGKRYSKTHYSNPGNGKLRAKTYQGIADAMADQWGG